MQRHRDSLDWVARNRQIASRAAPIGRCVGDRRERLIARRMIRSCVAAFVDDEFRAHCVLGEVDRAKVVILADSSSTQVAMRLKWLMGLREHLVRTCRAFGSRQIVFRVGEGDDRFCTVCDAEGAEQNEGVDVE